MKKIVLLLILACSALSFAQTPTKPLVYITSYGGVGDGSTDNTNAINEMITRANAYGGCGYVPATNSSYAHSGVITVPPNTCILGENRNSRFKYTGSSATASWILAGQGSPNYRDWFILKNIQFDANGLAQYAVQITDSVKGQYEYVEARNSTVAGFWCRGCVSDTWINPVVSNNIENFTTVPVNGMILDADPTPSSSGSETIINMNFEGVSGAGLLMTSVVTSNVVGGTSEANGIGIQCSAGCSHSHFEMVDMEANTSDLQVYGLSNTFTSMLATDPSFFNALARGNAVKGGTYGQITVLTNAFGNTFDSLTTTAAIADSGTGTTSRNLYQFSTASFFPDIIPTNRTYTGTQIFNNQATFNSQITNNVLPIWNFSSWQSPFIARRQPENYALQSGNATLSPWAYQHGGIGSNPIPSVSGATDPFGNTGTVTEVTFALNGGTTSTDQSILQQNITGLANPHISRQCIYIKANSGTPSILLGNQTNGQGVLITTTSSWQGPLCSPNATSSANHDVWELLLVGGGSTSNAADVLIYGMQDALNEGSYIATTTTPIDFTGYVPLGGSSVGFTLGNVAITSTSNSTLTNTVIPNCATGGSGTQVCDAAGDWVSTSILNAAQTIVSCSTSGTVTFSQPDQGSSYKQVIAYASACIGAASYTYPSAFLHTPDVEGGLASIVSANSTTAVTATGATSTGWIFLKGY